MESASHVSDFGPAGGGFSPSSPYLNSLLLAGPFISGGVR